MHATATTPASSGDVTGLLPANKIPASGSRVAKFSLLFARRTQLYQPCDYRVPWRL